MENDRFEAIEIKLAHQEDLLNQLNNIMTDQQAQLIQLRTICDSLVDRLKTVSDGIAEGTLEDERPPHY